MAARPSSSRTEHSELVLLSGTDLRRIMPPRQSIEALREAYRALADHRDDRGQSLAFAIDGGSIHVKAGLLPGSRAAFAAKVNINIPGNEARHGRPTIQGVVVMPGTDSPMWRDPEAVEAWAANVPRDRPVAVYCVYGFQVSGDAVAELRRRGVDARVLSGGIAAWRAIGAPTAPLTPEFKRGDAS
jgi:rhodanese-related sulfurtransferase